MGPVIDRLEADGVPVRHVDVSAEPQLARRYGIRQTPTFVVRNADGEVGRVVGIQRYDDLRRLLGRGNGGVPVRTGSKTRLASFEATPHNATATEPMADGAVRATAGRAAADRADAVARAATVRLKIHQGPGYDVGTGTIIDVHGDEALVLTCGHLFRDLESDARIEVELFVGGGQPRRVAGQLIDFESEDRDIALVAIRPGVRASAATIAPENQPPRIGDVVFSYGCDRGDDPTRRDTRISGVNVYNQHLGASNLQIDDAPAVGRSGGGLFDAAGQLVGVCNAADYQSNVGIYAGPGEIRWQLDRVDLARLYRGGNELVVAPERTAGGGLPPGPTDRDTGIRLASLEPAAPRGVLPPAGIGTDADADEIIILLRRRNRPGDDEVITIDRPTDDLVRQLRRHGR